MAIERGPVAGGSVPGVQLGNVESSQDDGRITALSPLAGFSISVCRWIETWGIRKGKPAGHAPDGSWYARSLATPSSTFESMYCTTRSPLSDPETVPLQQSGNSTIMTTPSNGSPNVL